MTNADADAKLCLLRKATAHETRILIFVTNLILCQRKQSSDCALRPAFCTTGEVLEKAGNNRYLLFLFYVDAIFKTTLSKKV